MTCKFQDTIKNYKVYTILYSILNMNSRNKLQCNSCYKGPKFIFVICANKNELTHENSTIHQI